MQRKEAPKTIELLKNLESKEPNKVYKTADNYLAHFDKDHDKTDKKTNEKSALTTTDRYYTLVTDFYEWGWGESFHNAPLHQGYSKKFLFAKHEYYLALKLKLEPSDKVLDCGCGIGGPARSIAPFAEAKVTGININDYQLERARLLTEKRNLQHLVDFKKENFNEMSFADGEFDKAYAIEATCHAIDVAKAYGEIYRVLKPGGLFGCYEWAMVGSYDSTSEKHKKLKHDIMVGNALPDIRTIPQIKKAVRDVGFEILENKDLNMEAQTPWFEVFNPSSEFCISSPTMRYVALASLTALEMVKMVPKGSVLVQKTLTRAADGLYAAGKEGIFTPMFYFLARKPLK